MRSFLLPLAAAALGAATMAAVATAGQTPDRDAKQAAEFAKITAGLVPGKPVDCIDTRRGDVQLKAYGDKLVYRFGRNQLYVSQTNGGCRSVARGDALVTRQFTGRLCRGDIARTVDTVSRMDTGGCSLGTFTPYTAG
jgi:hypothetical protein